MTIDQLRAHPAIEKNFGSVWPQLREFLTARLLAQATGAKATIDSAQAEAATARTLSKLITEFGTLVTPASDKPETPRTLKPLNSMTNGENQP